MICLTGKSQEWSSLQINSFLAVPFSCQAHSRGSQDPNVRAPTRATDPARPDPGRVRGQLGPGGRRGRVRFSGSVLCLGRSAVRRAGCALGPRPVATSSRRRVGRPSRSPAPRGSPGTDTRDSGDSSRGCATRGVTAGGWKGAGSLSALCILGAPFSTRGTPHRRSRNPDGSARASAVLAAAGWHAAGSAGPGTPPPARPSRGDGRPPAPPPAQLLSARRVRGRRTPGLGRPRGLRRRCPGEARGSPRQVSERAGGWGPLGLGVRGLGRFVQLPCDAGPRASPPR